MRKRTMASLLILLMLMSCVNISWADTDTKTVDIIIDKTKPTINFTGVVNGQIYYDPVTPVVTVEDNVGGSGLADGSPVITLTRDGTPVAWVSGQEIDQLGGYSLEINAVDKGGNTETKIINFTLSLPNAVAPMVTATGPTTMHLEWPANSGVKLLRNGTEIYAGSATTFDDTGLQTNTPYTYTLIFTSGFGTVTTDLVTKYTLANQPNKLSIGNINTNSATVSWGANGNPVGTQYQVQVSGTPQGTTISTAQSILGLAGNTEYIVTVVAINGDGVASTTSQPVFFRTQNYSRPSIVIDKQNYTTGETMMVTVTDGRATGSITVKAYGLTGNPSILCNETSPGIFIGYHTIEKAVLSGGFYVRYEFDGGDYVQASGYYENGPALTYSLVISPQIVDLKPGDTAQLNVVKNGSDGSQTDVTGQAIWTSSNNSIAAVAGGIVTALQPGQATITAKIGELKIQAIVNVQSDIVQTLNASPQYVATTVGDIVPITLSKASSDGSQVEVTTTAQWSTANSGVAEVYKGMVTAVSPGQTTISATVDGLMVQIPLVITKQEQNQYLNISLGNSTLGVGTKINLAAILTDGKNSTYDVTNVATWTSSDPSIAYIDSSGVLNVVAEGQTIITATANGYTTKSLIRAVSNQDDFYIDVLPVSLNLKTGDTGKVVAMVKKADGTSVDVTNNATWTVDNSSVVSLAEKGKLKALEPGMATVSVTKDNIQRRVIALVSNKSSGGSGGGSGNSGNSSNDSNQNTSPETEQSQPGSVVKDGNSATVTPGNNGSSINIPDGVDTIIFDGAGSAIIKLPGSDGVEIIVTEAKKGDQIKIYPVDVKAPNGQVQIAVYYESTSPAKLYMPVGDPANMAVFRVNDDGSVAFVPAVYDFEKKVFLLDSPVAGIYAVVKLPAVAAEGWAGQAEAWLIQRGITQPNNNSEVTVNELSTVVCHAFGLEQQSSTEDSTVATGSIMVKIVQNELLNSTVNKYIDRDTLSKWVAAYTNISTITREEMTVSLYWILKNANIAV